MNYLEGWVECLPMPNLDFCGHANTALHKLHSAGHKASWAINFQGPQWDMFVLDS